ncbi:hypothetical protein QQ045_009763 [Rhodiola kirilowii]
MRFAGANIGPRLLQLHKEIVGLVQGTMDVSTYHGKLLQLWGEEEALDIEELCDLGIGCKSTRTQITSMKLRPTLDEAYHMVLEDEMQRGLMKPALSEMSALYASQRHDTQQFQQQNNSQFPNSYDTRQFQRNAGTNNSLNKN